MKSLLFPIALTAVVAFVMIRSLPSYGPLHTEEAQVTFAYAPARTWHDVEVVYVFVGPRGQAILAERTSKEPLSLFGYNSGFQRVLRGKGGIDADILPPKP